MPSSHAQSDVAHARRLQHLGAAFAAFRQANPGRRFPRGIRAQVVAALNAGVSSSAIERACGLSWTQVTRWRSAAARGAPTAPSASALASSASAKVLSVVDADARRSDTLDAGIDIRVGPWRVSLSRAVD